MNLISGLIVSVLLIVHTGVYSPAVVTELIPNSAAESAGLQVGDEITKIGSTVIHVHNDAYLKILVTGDKPTSVTVRRGSNIFVATLSPQYSEEEGRYLIGYSSEKQANPSFMNAVKYGYYEFHSTCKSVVLFLGQLLTGQMDPSLMAGPLGIVSQIGSAVGGIVEDAGNPPPETKEPKVDNFAYLLYIFVTISANLGIFNLLPFPALDGGRIFFVLIEAIRRKKILPEVEGFIHFVGFACLIGLAIFATRNDISRIISG
jgi:regulator of sigma E protease